MAAETKAVATAAPSLPATYRALQVAGKGELKLVELPLVLPTSHQVLVRVISCGICHTDAATVELKYGPTMIGMTPGHEVTGIVAAVGSAVKRFKVGDRVGRGYHGGQCFQCDNCLEGEFFGCTDSPGATGVKIAGGYAEYMLASYEALARLPEGVSLTQVGPLACAGLTTFNALRKSGARAGDVVAIQGIGGLGHLGVQYARQMGFYTVAVSTGASKATLAKELGAHVYIDTSAQDLSVELQKLGGARVILATAQDAKSQAALVGGLGLNGELLILGVDFAPMSIPGLTLLMGRRQVKGWYSGTGKDVEATVKFSVATGVKSYNEVYPFEKFQEAYNRMLSGAARFRVVLAIAPEAQAEVTVTATATAPATATATAATAAPAPAKH